MARNARRRFRLLAQSWFLLTLPPGMAAVYHSQSATGFATIARGVYWPSMKTMAAFLWVASALFAQAPTPAESIEAARKGPGSAEMKQRVAKDDRADAGRRVGPGLSFSRHLAFTGKRGDRPATAEAAGAGR